MMADYAPVPPPDELDETYVSSLILVYSVQYVKTWRDPQNRKYITYYCIVVGGNRATATVNTTQKIPLSLDVVFKICERPNRHTDKLIAILSLSCLIVRKVHKYNIFAHPPMAQ